MNPTRNFRQMYRKKNRLGSVARKSTCNLGHNHDSRDEAEYCAVLLALKRQGTIKDFKAQVTFSMDVNGKHITNHRVDFLVDKVDGGQEIHEVKGWASEIWPLKKALCEALYPHIKYITINFQGFTKQQAAAKKSWRGYVTRTIDVDKR